MRITNVLFGLLLLLCVACDKSEKETPNGFKFKVLREGDGKVGKPGQVVLLDIQMKDSNDSIWKDSFSEGAPIPTIIGDSAKLDKEPGVMQILRMISKNDSIIFSLKVKELFNGQPLFPGLDTTLTISYRVVVRDIMGKTQFKKYQENLRLESYEKQLKDDIIQIDAYLKEKNIITEKTESGLRYRIVKPGIGENGKSGQLAKINYLGYTLEGMCFDTNVKAVAEEKGIYDARREPYTPYDVIIDQSGVIKGWHEILKLLNKGAKVTVYIPSGLAYGNRQRSEIIKPNSILVFDLEVIDLK